MKHLCLVFSCLSAAGLPLCAQVCDPAAAPTGLTSTYIPGTGALLEWNAVPGSVGVQLRAELPSGSVFVKRFGSFELDQFNIPESALAPGTYTWQVQAACSTIPPYNVTPISASSSFTVGGASTCPATVTDIDGNVYSTVQIGTQCWTAENLKVERYRDGSAILTGLSNSAWEVTTAGAYSVYDNNASNKATYVLLYNWYSAVDPRQLCPTDWHVPSDAEWTQLIDGLGGVTAAGGKMKTTGTSLWQSPNAAATNSSGFSGLPEGVRGLEGDFLLLGEDGYWWSSTEVSSASGWFRRLYFDSGIAYRDIDSKRGGFSVRCIKD